MKKIINKNNFKHHVSTKKLGPHTTEDWYFSGITPIADVAKALKINILPRREYITLAGFIMTRLGKIPLSGDQVVLSDYVFTVTEMDWLRIVNVQVQRRGETIF